MMQVRSWNACTGTTLRPLIPSRRKRVRAIFTGEEQI